MEVLTPFGPKIGMLKMPQRIIDQLNRDCLHTSNKNHIEKYDMSDTLIGQIELQTRFSPDLDCMDYLTKLANQYLDEHCKMNRKIKVMPIEAWYNRMMQPREYNPEHIHPGCLLTSVGYLKLPKGFKELGTRKLKNGLGGGLEIFHGEQLSLLATKIMIVPAVGDFFIFPASTRHAVYPMPPDMTGERRSFSINFGEYSES